VGGGVGVVGFFWFFYFIVVVFGFFLGVGCPPWLGLFFGCGCFVVCQNYIVETEDVPFWLP